MEDLTGKRFGKLTVLKALEKSETHQRIWLCKCDCGNTKEVTTRDLKNHRVSSCGCSRGSSKSLVGKRFGRLTVIEDTGEKQGTAKMWLCHCDCGNTLKVRTDSLTGGKTISCGCYLYDKERLAALNAGKKITDHTSEVFFRGTIKKNNKTGINGVALLGNGMYRAYIGYKNKIHVLYQGKDLNKAINARKKADEMMKNGGFEEWINRKKEK
jgi:hypothetical protein|nr:MAG TPA: hypothetical protein [Caudoviricetes sp.]